MAPLRTCVGCRARRPQDDLLRFVPVGERSERLVPDVFRRARGRGVYVCPSAECLEQAACKGGFARGLRRRVHVDTKSLFEAVSGALERASAELLEQMLGDGRAWLVDSNSRGSESSLPANAQQSSVRGRAISVCEPQDAPSPPRLDRWARAIAADRRKSAVAEEKCGSRGKVRSPRKSAVAEEKRGRSGSLENG